MSDVPMNMGATASRVAGGGKKGAEEENVVGSVVDTVEAIIIALILALTFRAFVVEAFVIPTGSMAPTLLGAHFKADCTKCGYHFDVEANLKHQYVVLNGKPVIGERSDSQGELVSNRTIPVDTDPIYCPNCGDLVDPAQLPQDLGSRAVEGDSRGRRSGSARFAWANNGDRILVMKYLYSVLEPERWDVIVFKEPAGARYNYIKRLIGKPGETVEIIDGDIFVAGKGKTEAGDRKIARKPEHIQKALWQLVYDNDFVPRDEGKVRPSGGITWVNPWTPTGGEKDWSFDGTVVNYAGKATGTLEFLIREGQDFYTLNTLGYNRDLRELANPERLGGALTRVGDLRLECVWTPLGEGSESVSMVAGLPRNCFKVTWRKGGVELERRDRGTGRYSAVARVEGVEGPVAGRSYSLALTNVDRAVGFYVDGKRVLEHVTDWSAADALAEQMKLSADRGEYDKPEIYLQVGGASRVGHLKVFRDLYYTNIPMGDGSGRMGTATQGNPLTLGEGEYFALGDNSRRSLDGRGWTSVHVGLDDLGTRRGVVPERYLLGKAFFVYWPAGFRIWDMKGLDVPLVPDAGDMRLIR